ncbi:unnamed protein product [Spirodela intermedia]|uniref:Uncharacterized protein n=1 Tax=Spirodela intermedia TaxID=51605 RepID=A0ABN7EBI7_SPIIN|nr:unnamed protein product [Spirodela intermedia]
MIWKGSDPHMIANSSSKSSPIDQRTSRRREEDDLPGDQSPPLESDEARWHAPHLHLALLRRVTVVEEP